MTNKILIVGLDGGSWNVLNLMFKKGLLKNLKNIIKNGASGILKSTHPPASPPAWTSFLTGVNPGKHGIFGFTKKSNANSYTLIPVNRLDIKKPSMWRILSDRGKKIISINVPMTFPPEKVNGYIITGMMTPDTVSNFTYPASLKKELFDAGIKYRIDISHNINKEYTTNQQIIENNAKKFFDDLYDLTQNRLKTSLYLLEKEWDIFMTVFVGTDRLQHFLWDYIDERKTKNIKITKKIYEYYNYLDECIYKIFKYVDDNITFIIISDHGFGRCQGNFYLNKWLKEQGFLKLKKKTWLLKVLKKIAKSCGLTSNKISKYSKSQITQKIRSWGSFIDWKHSKAYFSNINGININLKGRELYGCVQPGKEYEKRRQELIQKLLSIKDPSTNQPIIHKVYKKEEIFKGEFLNDAPDLLISFSETMGYIAFKTDYDVPNILDKDLRIRGNHRMDGIYIMNGKHIKSGVKCEAEIVDIFPTIFYLLHQPIPEYVDGHVLKEIIRDEFLYSNPIRYVAQNGQITEQTYTYSEDETEKIKSKLKGLGYM